MKYQIIAHLIMIMLGVAIAFAASIARTPEVIRFFRLILPVS
jgi:hypothetical protein